MEKTKVWYITGASKGMGLSLAKQLLAQGHKVTATSR
ncbi:MAG TPA: short-chain dehydrogenase/reductase, partial [Pedobacter sp.]